MSDVLGQMAELSEGRIVFLGKSEDEPGIYFIGFRNNDGEDLKFRISGEAFGALNRMGNDPNYGLPLREFPHKTYWKLVDWKEGEPVNL